MEIKISIKKKKKNVYRLMLLWEVLLVIPILLQYAGIMTLQAFSRQYGMIIALLFLLRIFMIHRINRSINIIIVMILFFLQLLTVGLNGTVGSIILSLAEVVMIYIFIEGLVYYGNDVNEIKVFWNGLLFIAMVFCCLNLIINGASLFKFWNNNTSIYLSSLSSVFSNKNTWGQFLFPMCIIAFFCFMETKKIKYILITGILLWNLISSFSRTSLFCFFIFATLFILLYKKWGMKKIIIIIILLIVVIFTINVPIIKSFVDHFYIIEDTSFTGRSDLWSIGIDAFLKHPILGIGMGKSPSILMLYTTVEEFHSEYIEILVAGGILKLCIIMFMMISSLKYSFKVLKSNRIYGAFCISFWGALSVYMLFESFQLFGRSLTTLVPTFLIITFPRILFNNLEKGEK